MKKTRKKAFIFYSLAVTTPAAIILAALAGLRIAPFGDHTLAISDGHALYLNYLSYVARAVKGQENILFSFEKGLGGNMAGSWGWFLLNPIFALFALFDITGYMRAYTWVSLLNFCLCGLSMYILLQDLYGHKLSHLIFSTAYAMNGFLVANVFQMNFFACIPVLPLMIMGLRRVMQNKNPALYILTLAYALLMNFYFGFMLCAASLLVFLVFFAADRGSMADPKSVAVKYIFSSLLAGALSAVVWLPALLSLRGGRLDQNIASAITFKENMPFLDMFSKLFTGANSTAELSNGLPNIFVGILPVYLVILFFLNNKIKKQRKIAAAALLLIYLLSFYIAVANILMHGGTVTNWFNYRDSFVFCFLLLMIAAEEWQHFEAEPGTRLRRAAVILTIATLIVFSKGFEYVTGVAVVIDLAVLALMLLALRMRRHDPVKNTRRSFTLLVLVLMGVNLFLNYYICTKNILTWDKKESEYQTVVTPVSALADGIQAADPSFFRMEVGEQWSGDLGNDPMLYGYYGVGHGGSDDRDFVRTALSQLGIRRLDMRNSYGSGIPAATDTLLGLKYIIAKDDLTKEKGYESLISLGEWTLYRNLNALPVALVADTAIDSVEIDFTDVFDNLNRVWSALTGKEDKIFVEESDLSFISHNYIDPIRIRAEDALSLVIERDASLSVQSAGSESPGDSESSSSSPSSADYEYLKEGSLTEPMENTSYIEYSIAVHQDGPVYSYNRSGMSDEKGSILPVLIYEGCYHAGDTVTKYLPVMTNLIPKYVVEDVAGRFRTVYADNNVLSEMSQTILERPSEIERLTDSHLRGTCTLEAGQELLFTIPYDEGWTLTVDGQKTELKKVLGVFMAAELSPGSHSYEMKFVPLGFKTGAAAAVLSLLVTACYVFLDQKKQKKEPTVSMEETKEQAPTDHVSSGETGNSNS